MLESIARYTQGTRHEWIAERWVQRTVEEPVAWRVLNYGPTHAEGREDYNTARWQWNYEQVVRRALSSLERRGLVTLGRHAFYFNGEVASGAFESRFQNSPEWSYTHRDNHIPGQTRIMIGALLTDAGWVVVRAAREEQS
jgi:hypothetical protein